MTKKKTTKEYISELQKKNIPAIPLDEYVGVKTKIKHKCLVHNIEFLAKPDSLLNSNRFPCPKCKKEKKKKVSDLLRMDEYEFLKRVKNANPYIELISKYISVNSKIKFRCVDCGFIDEIFASNLLRKRPCRKCGQRNTAISEFEYKNKLNEKFPHITYKGSLKTQESILHFHCDLDNYEWDTSARVGLLCGCSVCSGKTKNTYTYKKELKEYNSYVMPIEDYKTSSEKILHKCNRCNYNYNISPSALLTKLKNDFNICPNCSDGLSYPNKFAHELFKQLKNQLTYYECEYSPKWCIYYDFDNKKHKGRYDNYIITNNNKKIIVEMDGGFHSSDNTLSGQSKELSAFIDKQKDIAAKNNDCKIIRIDCNYLTEDRFNYIKNSIMKNKELNCLFDLKNIEWKEILLNCEKSYFLIACDFWNNGYSIHKIVDELNLSIDTIRKYLKCGSKNGFCTYNAKKEYQKSFEKIKKRVSKPCICIETNKIFNSIKEAGDFYGINNSSISLCCNGKRKTAGGKTWKYYIKTPLIN